MESTTKYPWYVLDVVLFALINILLLWQFSEKLSGVSITWLHVLLGGIAVYRAANVVSNEAVMKPLREPFVNVEHKDGKDIEVPKRKGFYGAMGSLLYCPSCTGTWISMIIFYAYLFSPDITSAIVIILALSGIERLLTSLYNLLKK